VVFYDAFDAAGLDLDSIGEYQWEFPTELKKLGEITIVFVFSFLPI
jgi:hypothetical protein